MSVSELMTELETAGVRLWEEAGQLRFRAPKGVMTPERLDSLRAHKAEVLVALRRVAEATTLAADPTSRYEPFPLTDVQAAYLLGRHDAFGYGGVACHIYLEVNFPELEPERLEAAWNRLIQHHDMLRAVIYNEGYQQVLPEVPYYRIRVADLRGASQQRVASALEMVRTELGHRVHETDHWPLFELRVTQADERSLLHLSIDFMIADWASIQQLLTELNQLYAEPGRELPQLEITFRDYVIAERGLRDTVRYERDRAYWWQRMDELPPAPELSVLDGGSNAAADGGEPRFQRWQLSLGPQLWSAFKRHAGSRGITASGAVLAAYAEAIGRWSRRPQFALNLTLLNRLPLHQQVREIVGDFTSVNLLAVDRSRATSFAERAAALGQQLFDDMDHRLCSGIEVMRELARRRGRDAALMPIVFTSAIGLGDDAAGQQKTEDQGEFGFGITQTPQVWIDCQALDKDGMLGINWDVREGVFPDGLVDDMFTAFQDLLQRLAAGDAAWEAVCPVGLPAAQAEQRIEVNETRAPLPESLLHEGVLDQAMRTPDQLAVLSQDTRLSYRELVERAAAVAEALRATGSVPDELVAVVMNKGVEQVVAVLGVLMAGGAYLPIDTNQPAARRDQVLADSGVRRILTQSILDSRIEWPVGITRIAVDALGPAAVPTELPARSPDDLAYVIYTSGSTGKPKGVMISHRGALNTIVDINSRFSVGANDRVLGLANLGFDLSVYDVFGPLSVGASLVLPSADRRGDPSHWAEMVATHGITVWNSVPAQLQMLQHYLDAERNLQLPTLRLALLSGDWIPVVLPDQIRARIPGLRVISLGGATEASIWSICYPIEQVDPSWRSIPYGKPLVNQSFHVLDSVLQDCPVWTPGELYIGGDGLALGYLNDEEKTAERFIVHPQAGQRLYRTGDYGRYLPDGTIEFLGREDFQVKIRGHRIELAEVETAIQSHPAVGMAVAIVDGKTPMQRRLIAFVEPGRSGDTLDPAYITTYLTDRLPDYMLPSQIQVVDAIPLSGNGKVDRKALHDLLPKQDTEGGDDGAEPRTELERAVAGLWAEVLGIPKVGREQDFYALGGDSLLAAKLAGLMRERIPEAAGLFFDSLVRQLRQPTVASLATFLSENAQQRSAPTQRAVISPLVRLGGAGDGTVRVLVHGGSGTLAPYGALPDKLADAGPVLGLLVNQVDPYLRMETGTVTARRASSYTRLLLAGKHRRVHLVGYGAAGTLAIEVARKLAESGVEIVDTTLIAAYPLPYRIEDELLIEYAFAREIGIDPAMLGFPADEQAMERAIEAVLAATPNKVPIKALSTVDGDTALASVAASFRRLGDRPQRDRLADIAAATTASTAAAAATTVAVGADHSQAGSMLDPASRSSGDVGTRFKVFRQTLLGAAAHFPLLDSAAQASLEGNLVTSHRPSNAEAIASVSADLSEVSQ